MEEITRTDYWILEEKLQNGKLPISGKIEKLIGPDSSVIYHVKGEKYLMDMRGICYFVKKELKKYIRRK